ncbi:MAG: DUF5060 domain-containing protein, partial [Planctomycetota bacterium]
MMRALLSKRLFVRVLFLIFSVLAAVPVAAQVKSNSDTIERWGIFELELRGPSGGNPFVDVQLTGEFKLDEHVFRPEGFYDGNGIYRIRFMPDKPG